MKNKDMKDTKDTDFLDDDCIGESERANSKNGSHPKTNFSQRKDKINAHHSRRRRKKSASRNILCILLAVLIVLVGLAVWILTRSKPEEIERNFDISLEEETDESIDEGAPKLNADQMEGTIAIDDPDEAITQDEGWIHYLLLGVDTGEGGDPSSYKGRRSDAMLILSINKAEAKVILSSIPRDTLVYIDGKGFNKLTHAYSYGGASLTIQTFEENFDIDVSGYITVNFNAMIEIVDLLGGLTLTLTDKEAEHMEEWYGAWGVSGGTQLLTGKEVLAYCRVRRIDSDYVRNDRQFTVLKTIYEEVKKMPATKYAEMITQIYDDVYTDLTVADCISLAGTVMGILDNSELVNGKLVDREHSTTPYLNNSSYVLVDDLEDTVIRWREEVLGIKEYVPSARVSAISAQLKKLVEQ